MIRKQVTVHTFAAFHYDVAYRKTFEAYLKMTLPIIDAGIDMLLRHPEFVFVVEQVIVMREYLARHPTALTPVRRLAQEGRLIFAPGMYTMPDVNLPSGESFIRNFLIGRDWLLANIGVEPKICWMADIFGHHAQIPQIAQSCGYMAYLFERGQTGDDDTLFWWQGLDGTKLLAQWQIDTYYGIGLPMTPHLAERGDAWIANFLEKGLLDLMHRNSAVKESLLSPIGGDFRMPSATCFEHIAAYNRLNRKYHIVFASPEAFFETVIRKHGQRLPVRSDDFNPMMQGTYTARIRLKQANRRLENGVAALEMLEAANDVTAPVSARVWDTIAINAFHDIICGTLEDGALLEALHDYARAERLLRQALAEQMTAVHGRRGTSGSLRRTDFAVSVFNSLPYRREERVEIPLRGFGRAIRNVAVTDAAGRPVECQVLALPKPGVAPVLDTVGKEIKGAKGTKAKEVRDDCAYSLLASFNLPPGGLQTFGIDLDASAAMRRSPRGLKASANVLENRFLKAVFGRNGTIISLIDKSSGCELAAPERGLITQKGMNNIMRQPDMGDLWQICRGPQNGTQLYAQAEPDPMADSGIEYQRRPPVANTAADADATHWPTIEVVEAGPLRAATRIHYPDLNITSVVSLARDENMLRFRTCFMPSGKRYRLRVAFPTAIRKGRIRTSIPCGYVERAEGEHPAQDWMDYSDGKRGLCLLNRGLPGNNVTDGVMLLSLFRAVGMEDAAGQTTFEAGVEQVFEYALLPFDPRDAGYHPARLGACFNRPFETAYPAADEPWPEQEPTIEVSATHVELMAYRKAGEEYEVRFYESEGRKGEVVITLSRPIQSCRLTDVRGLPVDRPAAFISGKQVNLTVGPFEIATLRIAF